MKKKFNYKKLLNKYKINYLKNKENNSNVSIYIRYNNLNFISTCKLRKDFLNLEAKLKILKQNTTLKYNKNLPISKGSICLVTIKESSLKKVYNEINNKKNLELLFVKINNNIYSNLKIKSIINSNSILFELKKPIILLNNFIKKADIT